MDMGSREEAINGFRNTSTLYSSRLLPPPGAGLVNYRKERLEKMKQEDVNEIGTCLLLLLDDVDYVTYPGCLTEMIGAAIPKVIIERCLKAKKIIIDDYRQRGRDGYRL